MTDRCPVLSARLEMAGQMRTGQMRTGARGPGHRPDQDVGEGLTSFCTDAGRLYT